MGRSLESKSSNIKGSVLLFSLVLAILIISGSYFIYSKLKTKPQYIQNGYLQRIILQPTPTPFRKGIDDSVSIPELFPEVSWRGPEIIDKEDNQIFIYISKMKDGGDWEFYSEPISLSGKRWTAELDKNDYLELLQSFESYYDIELEKRGWVKWDTLTLESYEITPLAADGPTGSSWGYLNVKNNSVQEVVLTNLIIPDNNTYTLMVDVGDPYNLGEMGLNK